MAKGSSSHPYYREAGDFLQVIRKRQSKTIQWLADSIGVSKTTVILYEQGHIRPSYDTAKSIAVALQIGMKERARLRNLWTEKEKTILDLWAMF